MDGKILVTVVVPELEKKYDVYIPYSKRVGEIISLLNKALAEFTDNLYTGSTKTAIYNEMNGNSYNCNDLIYNTDIRNGSEIILL